MITCGVVVLYNPTFEILSNIETYIYTLHRLYVIDNSDACEINVEEQLERYGDRVEYIAWGENRGIAAALNEGARRASNLGSHWLLTMDQDSRYYPGAFEKQLDVLATLDADELKTVGILACRHVFHGRKNSEPDRDIVEQRSVITSGNLVNLQAFLDVGGFREALFIDEVDSDFCLRLRRANYKILVANEATLMQYVGNTRTHSLLFFDVQCSHHSYVRRYYITRNRLYLSALYPELKWTYLVRNMVSMLKILLFEADKQRKLLAFVSGITDHYKKRYGKKVFHD